jgi:polyisoprenoid-binding protein YceI
MGISLFLFLPSSIFGQQYQLDSSSIVKVIGSSNLRDWTVIASTISLILEGGEDKFSSASFTLDTKSLDGGRGESMNTKIYKALQSDTHQFITFNSKSIQVSEDQIIAEGELSIAGQTKTLKVNFAYQKSESQIHLKANIPLKMSAFSVEPPTALFGQIVAKDDIAIDFTLTLVKK